MTKYEKDRETTEKRLMNAVGEIIDESGIEFLGINSVAKRAGVAKMLIYRYFGSLEDLIAKYIMQWDYWVNVPSELPGKNEMKDFLKKLFHGQIRDLRDNKLLIRLHRWELSSTNPLIEQIRKKREENGIKLIEYVSTISGLPFEQVQVVATLISSSVTYLAMFGDVCAVYNGLYLQDDDGWDKLEEGINILIDKMIPNE